MFYPASVETEDWGTETRASVRPRQRHLSVSPENTSEVTGDWKHINYLPPRLRLQTLNNLNIQGDRNSEI